MKTYLSGHLIYVLLRSEQHARKLKRWSHIHMLVIHAAALLLAIPASIPFGGPFPLLRPAVVLTSILTIFSVVSVTRGSE